MGPIIIPINSKQTLLKPVSAPGRDEKINEINIKSIILRPMLKKIVFITNELNNIVVYSGENDFEAHKNDSNEVLITTLINFIDTNYI